MEPYSQRQLKRPRASANYSSSYSILTSCEVSPPPSEFLTKHGGIFQQSGNCYNIHLKVLSLIVWLISVLAWTSYCVMLLALILGMSTGARHVNFHTHMTSLCLLSYIPPRFPSLLLLLLFPNNYPFFSKRTIRNRSVDEFCAAVGAPGVF